jgi:nitrite reductase (NADH) small subunit/3-phenylpropionate/trans-cinnamate dioxygenase ferredoxin subunit
MAEFVTVCRKDELPPDGGKAVAAGKELIAVFNDRGTVCAITDVCPHMGASLAGGELEGGIVTCPWHGWRFRVADGVWADNPKITIPRFETRVVGDEVQVKVES